MTNVFKLVKNFLIVWVRSFNGKKEEIERVSETPNPKPSYPWDQPHRIERVSLIVGHSKSDKGAYGHATNEWDYNSFVAEYVKANSTKQIGVFYRGATGIVGVAAQALTFKPDLCVELHLNSATAAAKGCEVLVKKGDKPSDWFGQNFAQLFCKKFARTMRRNDGTFDIGSSDRGYTSLRALELSPAEILVEPFFLSNPAEKLSKEEYAQFLLEWINGL